MAMNIVRIASLIACVMLWPLPASSQNTQSETAWLNALRAGGHVIVFRHGATQADQADTDPLNLNNVSQQRQLSDQGRALARLIGNSIRKLAIPVGPIHTSMFNRAVETGALMGLGSVTKTVDLTEGGLVVTPIENNRRAQAMRKLVATVPPGVSNAILVSHKPNIMDAFGRDWFDVQEGEASVFKPDGRGGYTLVVRVQANEWSKLVQTASN